MKDKATLADVAREANVSAQTVSRVINNKGEISHNTRLEVQKVIERLGYRPNSIARGLATAHTMTIGLVVPDIANPVFPEVASGVEDTARQHGYTIFLCNTFEDPKQEEEVLSRLADKHVDGLIICGPRLPDEKLIPLLKEHSVVVLVNRPAPPEIAGMVLIDDIKGMQQVVSHLFNGGHRTIGLLSGPPNSYSGKERTRGFLLAMQSYNLTPGYITNCPSSLEGGYKAALEFLVRHREIDSLVCYNDLVAIGALRAAAELGRKVPGDLAIVGCDDILLAELVTPSLTTLHASKKEIGRKAAQLLFQRLNNPKNEAPFIENKVIIDPLLIIRASAP